MPKGAHWEADDSEEGQRRQRTREKMRAKLAAGELEDKPVELAVEQKMVPLEAMIERVLARPPAPPSTMVH